MGSHRPKIKATISNTMGRVVKIYGKDEADEYRAALFVDGKHYEPADAFDSDWEGINGTAKAMLEHTEKNRSLS